MRYLSCLILITGLLFLMLGCGEENDLEPELEPELRVVSVSPSGGDIFAGTIIKIVFSKKVASVKMKIGDILVEATSSDQKIYYVSAIWKCECEFGLPCELAIDAIDEAGQSLSGYTPCSFRIHLYGDVKAPEIVDKECIPINKALDVDPASVDEILIVFDEELEYAGVVSFTPQDAKIASRLDGNAVTISFLDGYQLGNDMKVIIELDGSDLAGFPLAYNTSDCKTIYSFTTKAKE